MSNGASDSARDILCLPISVIADSSARRVTLWLIADLYFRTLPGITTGPSTFGLDRRADRRGKKRISNDHLKKYRFVIFWFSAFFSDVALRTSERRMEFKRSGTSERSYTHVKVDKSKSDRFRTHLKRIDRDNSIIAYTFVAESLKPGSCL